MTSGRALACTLLLAGAAAAAEPVFRHSGRAQLARGELGNAGQNLFVSARGELKLVNWFDLDRDGFPEIVINNEHNPHESVDGLIYHQHAVDGFQSLLPVHAEDAGGFEQILALRRAAGRTTFLPALGSGRSLITDLNADGFPDIAFVNFIHGSTHDQFPAFVYWGGPNGFSATHRAEFPTELGLGLTVADLDGDGRLDLVIANAGNEDRLVAAVNGPLRPAAPASAAGATAQSRIFWQREDGFAERNSTGLPTRFAVDVKAADLDGDGRFDLVFLQGGDTPSVRVFYGDAGGYALERSEEIPVDGRGFIEEMAGEITVADLNADQRPDLIVTAGGPHAQVFWNRFWHGRGNLREWPRTALPAPTPLSAAVGDFNRDGLLDVAVAGFAAPDEKGKNYETETLIYWGAATRTLVTAPPTALPALGATTVRAADLNGDGFLDLALANSRNNHTYDVPSYVYWGGESGLTPARRTELTGFGPASLALGDLDRDRLPDIYLANRDSGLTKDASPLNAYIYWGNPHRSFSSAVLTKVPLMGGYSCVAADFFDEGRAAVAYTDDEGVLLVRFNARRQIAGTTRVALPFRGMSTVVGDLDRDGRLDLLVVGMADGGTVALLRGTEQGFAAPQNVKPGMQVLTGTLADLSGTGRLELVLGGRGGWMRCPLGADGTPDFARATRVSGDLQIQRLTVADLNDDGLPEVVAAQYREMSTRRNAINSAIYWNRAGRFSLEDRSPLATFGAHWVSVADTTNQGRLDVIFSNYHGETTRTVPLFLYHPDERGAYRSEQRRTLPAFSSSSNLVADFDRDGFNDIVVVNHTGPHTYLGTKPKSARHSVGSFVYWGAKDGYDENRRSWIASHGPHATINADVGDVLRRRPFETYTSPWVDGPLAAGRYTLVVAGTFRGQSGVTASVQPDGASTWTALTAGTGTDGSRDFEVVLDRPAQRLRYRLDLQTGGAGTGPTITAVELRAQP